jgi:hypothetical protein
LLATVLVAGMAGAFGAALPAAAGKTFASAPLLSLAYTDSGNTDTTYANPTSDVPLGAWLDPAGTLHTSRVYGTFDISAFSSKEIPSAYLYVRESKASDCQDRAIQVWTTADASSPTWADPPDERAQIGTIGGGAICPATVGIDLTSTVADAAAAHKSKISLELRVPAVDESAVNLGRWLSPYDGPSLTVVYNTPPQVPTELYNTYLPCGSRGDSHPYLGLQPLLQARFTDLDAGDRLAGQFEIWPLDHPDQTTLLSPNFTKSGWVSGAAVPAGLLADGARYAWHARLNDGTENSAWSRTCYFTTDGTRPATAPGVTSSNYPNNGTWTTGGTPAHFTFSPSGVADVIGYVYSWNDYPGVIGIYSIGAYGVPIWTDPFTYPGTVRAPCLGGSVGVDLSPPWYGPNRLYVKSIDRAFNVSPFAEYDVMVTDTTPTVTQVSPEASPGQPLTLKFTPNSSLSSVDSYIYRVNGGAKQTVPAGPDGSATVTVTPSQYAQFTVEVSSHSPNGWVSPERNWTIVISNSPHVSSDVYPPTDSGTGGGGVGVPGTFTFTPGMPDVATYFYSIDWGDAQSLTPGADGSASITWTPDTSGYHEIEVYSIDTSGNMTDYNFYAFIVNDSA